MPEAIEAPHVTEAPEATEVPEATEAPEARARHRADRGLRAGGASRGSLARSILVALALLGWLVIAAFGGIAQGTLSQVQENDEAAFLPASSESNRADGLARDFSDSEAIPALVVLERADGEQVSPADLETIADVAAELSDVVLTGEFVVGDFLIDEPAVAPAEDGEAAMIVLSLDAEDSDELLPDDERVVTSVVSAVRAHLDEALDSSLQAWVTGPAGSVADLVSAFGGIDSLLLVVALSVVLLILVVVYRSPILPLLVMFTSVSALCLAALVVKPLAGGGALALSGQTQGILSILVIGAATDYGLLMVARYREELRFHEHPAAAMWAAWRACLAPIAASAGTVIVGLLCLMLSDLASNASLGPVAAIGIAASVVGALTLLPALLLIGGRRSRGLFWPRRPTFERALAAGAGSGPQEADEARPARGDAAGGETRSGGVAAPDSETSAGGAEPGHRSRQRATGGLWPNVAEFVARHARPVWIVTAVVLLGMTSLVTTFRAEGTSGTDIFLAETESVTGEEVLAQHFDAGTVQPVQVVTAVATADDVIEGLADLDGVTGATAVTAQDEAGMPGEGDEAGMPGEGDGAGPPEAEQPDPLVVDGRVLVEVTTTESAESQEALDTVAQIRELVRDIDSDALVGGAAAQRVDTQQTARADLGTIIPLVLVAIFVMLVLLLRAVVAPLLLLGANLLSFGATMGLAAVLFNHVFDFPGADATVPLFGFVFLVALSIDYSIFLMTRVREEALSHGTRAAVRHGLVRTGPVITSAGLVLAATFSALAVIPLLFLVQIAVIVAAGVLIDTFVVRSLLVPGLVHDVGRTSWWPWQRRIPADPSVAPSNEPVSHTISRDH